MAAPRSRWQRWRRLCGAVAGLALVALVALPVWLPWALGPVLGHYRITFAGYERLGYTRFALTGVEFHDETVRLTIQRAEAFTPFRWLWQLRRAAAVADAPPAFLTVTNWRVEILDRPAAGSRPDQATFRVLEEIESIQKVLRVWLPAARLTDGAVLIGFDRIDLPAVAWERGKFSAQINVPQLEQRAEVRVDFSATAPHELAVRVEPLAAQLTARVNREPERWTLDGRVRWQDNRIGLEAQFGRAGWWPRQASVTADPLRVPAGLIGLRGYEDPTGAARLTWQTNTFELSVAASAQPLPGQDPALPPVEVTLSGRGDLDSAQVEKLRIAAPWLQAELSEAVGLHRTAPWLTGPARFEAIFDLNALPGSPLAGQLRGTLTAEPAGLAGYPPVRFAIAGSGLRADEVEIASLELAGELRWPEFSLERAVAAFAEGSRLSVGGRVDVQRREIAGGEWELRGGFLGRFLPAGWRYTAMNASGQVSGPLTNLAHSGGLALEGFSAPPARSVDARARWTGRGLDIEQMEVRLVAGPSELTVRGAVSATGPSDAATDSGPRTTDNKPASRPRSVVSGPWAARVVLDGLSLRRAGDELYHLERPCEVRMTARPRAGEGREARWSVRVDSLRWVGEGRELTAAGEASWPARGRLGVGLRGFDPALFRDFIALPAPGFTVGELDFNAEWQDGPATFDLSLRGELALAETEPLSVRAELRGDAAGLTIDPLTVSGALATVVSIRGSVPLRLEPGAAGGLVQLGPNEPMDLRATTEPNAAFWDHLAELTGARLQAPEVQLAVRGTPAAPEGVIQMRARAVELRQPGPALRVPRLENFVLDAELDRAAARLRALSLEVEGQPVRVTGEVPLGGEVWAALVRQRRLPDWRQANARLLIADAQLAPFAPYLPKVLSPQGRLDVDLAFQPGGLLAGELRLADAATRPLPPVGPIREIGARVRFDERRATIEEFSGGLGGQPVRLTGAIELAEEGAARFELALRGENVPLVREPGMILRADLDVALTQTNAQPPAISGEIVLRDSLYLHELKLLAPGRTAQPRRRPPYFSVEEAPFADWTLDLRLRGERFLRVRSPLFRGEVSAAARLGGTLREPVAVGEARVASGVVLFPFGNLTVEQGLVSLVGTDPHRPELFLSAGARSYGYNISLEVTGPADEPLITFTSTPPLNSEEIILMLTAGQLPRREFVFSGQERAGQLAVFFARDLLGRFGADDGFTDRLMIRTGENLAEQGGLTYYVEYQLSDRWWAVGEYDRFNAFNAGLKWRVYSR